MFNTTRIPAAAFLALAFALAPAADAAQTKGRIVCWKDKSGKIVGCGDTVPPEYQTSATQELDRRGITRKTTDSADDLAKRKTQDQELARKKDEEQKRLSEQRRQDAALVNTFSSEKEIDVKRDRDLQVVELQINQLRLSLKNTTDRKGVEQSIAAKEKEQSDIRARYAEYKKRFAELKGLPPSTATTPAPAAAAGSPQKK
jgi:hypothetical protein